MIPSIHIIYYNKLQFYKSDLLKKYSDFYNCESRYIHNYQMDYNVDVKNLKYNNNCKDKYDLLCKSFNEYYTLLKSFP